MSDDPCLETRDFVRFGKNEISLWLAAVRPLSNEGNLAKLTRLHDASSAARGPCFVINSTSVGR